MQYSKLQRFTSFFILFFFLFWTTFHFPISDGDVFADDEWYKNIVSIIVNEDIYPSIKGSLWTYSNNISEQLENTKVVILPTPSDTSAYEIASLNESLYFEGLESIDNTLKNWKLIGTVLIGDLNLAIAYDDVNVQKTIVPYVDFEDKYFIYNHVNWKFEKNENNIYWLGAEIWHGVISPNLWNDNENIDAIKNYFSKNNDYYKWEGLFDEKKWILNWNIDNIVWSQYEPYVFYFDQIRESQSINLDSYNGYQAYQENKEDIIYQRFNSELADTIQAKVLWDQEESIEWLQDIFWDSLDIDDFTSATDLNNVPDIQTRHIVNNATNKFVEVFSQWWIWELRKNVHNAWRYNWSANEVNVDFIPYLITVLDGVNDEILKEASYDIENEINTIVHENLQKDIYIPYRVELAWSRYGESYTDVYINLLSGSDPSWYNDAIDCTPFRWSETWSWVVTLWSRWLVLTNVESDISFLESIDDAIWSRNKVCLQNINTWISLESVFWWITPLNLDQDKTGEWDISLNYSNLDNSILPVFDIQWSYTDANFTASSYQQCLDNNFFAYTLHDVNRFDSPHIEYQLPALWVLPSEDDWSCIEPVAKWVFNKTYEDLNLQGLCSGNICTDNNEKYFFKKISSAIEHIEPTVHTITSQIQYGISPNLPIDDNRYIDFQDISWNYKKINYPYLFRLTLPEDTDFSYENIDTFLESYFSDNKENFWWIDIYDFLKLKWSKELIIWEDIKNITYLDSLIFAIYWNNLNSVSAKYKFVFENYLSDQFVDSENNFNLAKNKKQYEVSYLGANWDAENLYLQINPESKADNPYADVVKENAELKAELLGKNLTWSHDSWNTEKEAIFKCAPPEWVPIYEWIPAIVCWIDDILPPTITVSHSTCWPTIPLLSLEDQEYLEQCHWDVDWNWINDCLENRLRDGSIGLYSDTNRIYYNKPWKITAELFDDSDNILNFDNHTKISFNLEKIEIPNDATKEFTDNNTQVVYSQWQDLSVASEYINFVPSTLLVQAGIAESQFTAKWNDANYYFSSSLEVINSLWEKEISKESNTVKIEVRWDRLFSTLYNVEENIDNGEIDTSIENKNIIVSDASQIFLIDKNLTHINDVKNQIYSVNNNIDKSIISLENISKEWNNLELNYPLSVSISNSKNNDIVESVIINSNELDLFYPLSWITKSGHYILEITDSNWFVSKKELDFIADDAENFELNLWATTLESNWAISSNVVTLLDKFDNVVTWKNTNLEIEINNDNIVFEENQQNILTSQVFEWYKIFRLKSLDNTWTSNISFTLKDFFWEIILSENIDINIVDNIWINIIDNADIKVWWETYEIKIQIEDRQWDLYSDFNSRLYFTVNDIYWTITQPYFDVINWIATVELNTNNLAWSDIPIEIQIEWLTSIFNDNIKINHDIPVYLELWIQEPAVEANPSITTNVELYIKDKYWNITFDVNSGSVDLEILPEFEKYISSNWVSQVNKWISNIKLSATDLPGKWYFKVSYEWLNVVWNIDTYYYWNNSVIEKWSYNSLYTTLLWAAYWDITTENYLGGSLLFNDNRSLTVTSLLNNPYKENEVVIINNKWGIKSLASSNDLSTDIKFNTVLENGKLHVSVKNIALGHYIWKIQPILWWDTLLELCNWNNGDLWTCNISNTQSSIILQSDLEEYNAYSDNESLYIQDSFWRRIFSINKDWNIERKADVYFDLDSSDSDLLQISIYLSGDKIWTLWYNLLNSDIKSTRNIDLFNNTINSVSNTILILLSDWSYASKDSYNGWIDDKVIYFNSPFDTWKKLNSFNEWNIFSYENFEEKSWLWWSEWNKSLLQFTAGQSVWESVKSYQSFSLINLWDPVVSLKKIKKSLPWKIDTLRTFDGTVWKLISNTSTVESYTTFDYNNDKKEDLLLIHNNKYLELLENSLHEKDFNSLWNIAQLYDLWSANSVKWWDFTGDWYYDIFFINNEWKPFILNNINKDFERLSLWEDLWSTKIVRSEVFDMDNDGKHDIVVLDEKWDINIFFWWGSSNEPEFLLKNVWNAWMPELNSDPRTDNWAIYFDWLISLWLEWDNSTLINEAEAFQRSIEENTANLANNVWNGINTWLIDGLVFVQIPYTSNDNTLETPQESLINSINTRTSEETQEGILNAQNDLTELLNNPTNTFIYPDTYAETTESDFIKSEYAEILDIDISKTYNWELIGWSNIDFSLEITNKSNKRLDNIAYVEDVLTLFTVDNTSFISSKDVNISYDSPGYDFMIDDFNLEVGETFTLSAKLLTAPISYGYIQVWLFENDEVWDDDKWDIFYSTSHESCWETKVLFRSCWVDSNNNNIDDCNESDIKPWYIEWNKTPKCNDANIELPDNISENVQDNNTNWIPDYIENLTNWSREEQSIYAESVQNDLYTDSDWDGIPDYEDFTDSSNDFLSNLEDIEDNVDHILIWIDNLIQWLSCGFGWGWCIATPLNWAPLAPGWDPTLFGAPIWDGLKVNEWLPVFSALTWIGAGPLCVPSVWPASPLSEGCSGIWAGGYLWVNSPSNFFRLFATPTLTGGFWVAACFWWPASIAWYSNLPWLHPLLPGWNCIVTTTSLSSCSNDWSDWDPWSVWFSNINGSSNLLGQNWIWNYSIINANCNSWNNVNSDLDLELVQEYLDYKTTWVKTDSFEDKFIDSFTQISQQNNWNTWLNLNEPLIQINGQWIEDAWALNIDFSSIKSWNFSDVISIQNRRISAFPNFLMWWVTRQVEEIVNKLTDFPTIFIILPDFTGVIDSPDTSTSLVWSWTTKTSGIQEAYTFLSNVPLITIEQESLNIDIPWIDSNEIEATKKKWWSTVDQWVSELDRAKKAWSFWWACDNWDLECKERNEISQKVTVEVEWLIWSLEKNIEVIQTYKDFPKDLNSLINKKEDYLEQILCNVESISTIIWSWIWQNWERFKAWVELYILIKAILKSWQLLIDVFVDYEAECYECKNERWDLMTFIWQMISVVIPKIPVIQFPKWPDIIMDLHNVRAGLTISLPEFNFNTRPILLPELPNLYLPDVPTLAINWLLPELPILPVINIPELPDLPALPTVELPNLPPPPTLPKLFASLESILEIIKAITKAMCILKTSPFVPEWRAWDQIAFLTERQWYLPTDFIDISLPQFSYPFVDAIKVTTFVNLEFETDFITELARQITLPLTTFSNDFTSILNIWVDDLDFRLFPSSIDLNIWTDGVEWDISYSQDDLSAGFAIYISKWISNLVNYLDTEKNKTVSNNDFKILVAESLSSDVFVSHPKYWEFRNVWDEVFDYSFDKENELIAELQKNNFDKFQTLENILHTEILKNKEVQQNLEQYIQPNFIQKVDVKINSDVDVYNAQLEIHNQRFIDSAIALIDWWKNKIVNDLEIRGEELITSINSQLVQTDSSSWHNSNLTQCQEQSSSPYRYDYEGLYTIENIWGVDYSYHLFDYLDELTGREEIRNIDSDNDWDIDVIYMMNWQIFLKENLEITNHNTWRDVVTISSDNNPFYNGSIFYSSVDNLKEGSVDNNIINAKFSSSTDVNISNYRMSLTRLIDKQTEKISIIDWFTNSDENLFERETDIFSFWKNIAYIKNLWKLKNLVLETKEYINIKDDLLDWKIIDISSGTKIYAWNESFRITYIIEWTTQEQIVVVSKNKFIEINESINIIWISWNAYIEWRYDIVLEWENIRSYKWLPLSLWAHISYIGDVNTIDPLTYLEINYYDETEVLLNFNFIEDYWLHDLWRNKENLTFSLDMDNDYLYWRVQGFNQWIFSTYSNQIVLSPQKEADNIAPELYLNNIKIPVYQTTTIDLWNNIYDEWWIRGIQEVIIDMNLDLDSDADGDPKNDMDINLDSIIKTPLVLEVIFDEYDYLTKKLIGITLVDENNNRSYNEIQFEVYSPTPQIEEINELWLVWVIDENLDNEPVSLFRYRWGVITKLNNNDESQQVFTQWWDYIFDVNEKWNWLTLDYAWENVAEILETTWKIILNDFSSNIKVYSSNHQNNNSYYPKIEIEKNWNTIYYQYLQVSEWKTVNTVESFDNISNQGIYMKFTNLNDYGYYKIPETVSYNPWAFVIYKLSDLNKEPLFIIFPDGKINTLNDSYVLEYNFENDYIVLNLIDTNNDIEISQLLFSIDGWYILK